VDLHNETLNNFSLLLIRLDGAKNGNNKKFESISLIIGKTFSTTMAHHRRIWTQAVQKS